MNDRLSAGYEPDFDIDYKAGVQGELFVQDIIESLRSERVEVKTDEKARETGNAYIEFACLRLGKYRASGIAITKAEWWVHVLEPQSLAVVIGVERLKILARKARADGRVAECVRGSHPTKGVLIPLKDLLRDALRTCERKTS